MWNMQRMSFYVENLHLYNNFFVKVYGKSMGEKSILGISRDLRMISVHIEMIGRLTESVNCGGNSLHKYGSVLSLLGIYRFLFPVIYTCKFFLISPLNPYIAY